MVENRYRKRAEVVRFSSGSSARNKNILKNTPGKKSLYIYADGVAVGSEIRLLDRGERHPRRPAGPPVCTERNVPGRTLGDP